MTKREVIEMLTAKAECIRRESSGIDVDCNFRNCDECDLCYKQGTMGDQMEALGVAISALQAQDLQPICNELAKDTNVPCKDTISRQAAIDAIEPTLKSILQGNSFKAINVMDKIRGLPSAQSEPQWIPVSEKLPEENHWLGGSGRQVSYDVLISVWNSDDKAAWIDISHTIDGEWELELLRHCQVVAWCELPEPYKGDEK